MTSKMKMAAQDDPERLHDYDISLILLCFTDAPLCFSGLSAI